MYKTEKIKLYIYIYIMSLDTHKDCYLLQKISAFLTGRTPYDKTAIVLTTTKIWSWVPEGLNAKMEGLTDRQLQSNSDSYLSHYKSSVCKFVHRPYSTTNKRLDFTLDTASI